MTSENGTPVPAATTEPNSIFGSFFLDDTYRGLHQLTMPLTLAPIRLDAGRSTGPSRFRHPSLKTAGYIVRGLLNDSFPNRYTSQSTANGMAGPVGWCSPDNHTCDFMSRPFVESVGGNQAAPPLQNVAERWLLSGCFRPSVDHASANGRILRPRRDQPPAHE